MKNQILLLLTGMMLGACTRGEHSADTMPTGGSQLLYSNRAVRLFSDSINKDTVQVTVNGESLLTGQVYLNVISNTGKNIYWDRFPVTELIGHDGPIDPGKDEEQVRSQLNHFFASSRFSRPGSPDANQLVIPDSARTAWKSIESDPKATIFLYPARTNSLTGIAYSQRLKKVIASTGQ
jgi:hypothetical protein